MRQQSRSLARKNQSLRHGPTPTSFTEIVSDGFPVLRPVSRHADEEYGLRESANVVVSAAAINVCCEQSTYGDGIGVAAARGHLDVPVIVALEPSVVSDVGPGLSSGVGLGVSSDFGLARCPAPWSAPPCPAPPPRAC